MCYTIIRKVLNAGEISLFQLAGRSVKSLNGKGTSLLSNTAKISARINSFFVQQPEIKVRFEQPKNAVPEDSNFEFSRSELDVQSSMKGNYICYYSTKKPYVYPSQKYILSSPPTCYKPIGVQLLARHGSRTLASHNYDLTMLTIWQLAKEKNMLTPLGEQLKEDIELFINANNQLGRGELTRLGKEEHFGIGSRLFNRLKPLFTSSNTISVMTSGKKRAIDSAQEFLNGLTRSNCNVQILYKKSEKKLLYFHKSCENYMTFKNNDPHIKAKLNLIKDLGQTRIYARQVLKRIYTHEFVEILINGNYEIESNTNAGSLGNETTRNEVDVVLCLYSMLSVAPAHNQRHIVKMLDKYFNQEESNWFAYINDAREFYFKGPSIEGTTVTYDMAKPLLTEFFSSTSELIEAKSNVTANLRFAHAETIIPLATLLQIPDFSDEAVHLSDTYTYENNWWRGDNVAPMAANIQWEIYRHEDNHQQILVRMLYNEMEVRFKEGCKSVTPGSFFYDFNELKRSYANVLLPSVSNAN